MSSVFFSVPSRDAILDDRMEGCWDDGRWPVRVEARLFDCLHLKKARFSVFLSSTLLLRLFNLSQLVAHTVHHLCSLVTAYDTRQ